MINWQALRELHLDEYKGTYLNSPANGLPSIATEAFITNEISKFREAPGEYRMRFITKGVPAIKAQVSSIINSTTNEIALIQNFSIGLNFFVQSLPIASKILLIKDDYPSLTKPFEINDLDIVWTTFEENGTLDLSKIESHLINDKPSFFCTQPLSVPIGVSRRFREHRCTLQ